MARIEHRLARRLATLVATATILLSCSDDDSTQSIDPATTLGELRVELVDTKSSGAVYRVGQAQLQITGPTSAALTVDRPELRTPLAAGDYTAELLPGWVLERRDGQDFQSVRAQLVSPNPTTFSIVSGETTSVTVRFDVEDSGEIMVRVGVGNDAPCRAQASYGDLGPLTARLIADGRTRGLSAPLGEPRAGTELELLLRSGRGVFGDGGPIEPGTYALAGAEVDFATCGVCLLVHGDRDPLTGVPRQSYLASGGSVTIDSVYPTLAGSLRDVTLSTVASGQGGAPSTENACTTAIAAATFSLSNP